MAATLWACATASPGGRAPADETVRESPATTALLDEVVAGYEANEALIQHGTAKYGMKWTEYSPPLLPPMPLPGNGERDAHAARPPGPATFSAEFTVYFDYPRLRIDRRGNGRLFGPLASRVIDEWQINSPDALVEYGAPGPDTFAENHIVVVSPPSLQPTWSGMHPRQQLPYFTIARNIRGLRTNPKASMVAEKQENGLIRIDIETPGLRDIRWISPDEGYYVVRSKWWDPEFTSEAQPRETIEISARRANNGAYVVGRRTIKVLRVDHGKLEPERDEELTLLEIDLLTRPDEKLFALDALNLPIGATIKDDIHGRRYEYGVAAVNEKDIKVPPASGLMKQRHWPAIGYAFVGIALVAAGFLSYGLRRRRAAGTRPDGPPREPPNP